MTRLFIPLLLAWLTLAAHADDVRPRLTSETVYLPIYSHVWHGDAQRKSPAKLPLSALVSIRSTDPTRSIKVLSARYYDTQGKLLGDHLKAPRNLPPLGTLELLIERREDKGGSGANFLIEWQADSPVVPPLIQAVHVDIQGTRSLAFITEGRPIEAK